MSVSSTSTISLKLSFGASTISTSPRWTGAPSVCDRSPLITMPSNGACSRVRSSWVSLSVSKAWASAALDWLMTICVRSLRAWAAR